MNLSWFSWTGGVGGLAPVKAATMGPLLCSKSAIDLARCWESGQRGRNCKPLCFCSLTELRIPATSPGSSQRCFSCKRSKGLRAENALTITMILISKPEGMAAHISRTVFFFFLNSTEFVIINLNDVMKYSWRGTQTLKKWNVKNLNHLISELKYGIQNLSFDFQIRKESYI